MRNSWWILILVLAMALVPAACGDDDDDDNDDATPIDDDTVDDDDDTIDDDDDDATPDDDDDDTIDDDDDDTAPDLPPIRYVDPMIGTGGLGFGYASGYPGPKNPFGMMSLSPDTTLNGLNFGFNHFSGYYYPDTQIRGFTHTHLYGTGAPDLSTLLLMPTTSRPLPPISERKYRSNYQHVNERSVPGYYSVFLDDPEVLVELATVDYAAIHRYTYPEKSTPFVMINPSYSIEPGWAEDATVTIEPNQRRLSGMIDFHGPLTGRNGGVLFYYTLEFSAPFDSHGTWTDGWPTPNGTFVQGADVGAYVGFGELDEPLLIRVGISYQSVEQAQANLDDQMPEFDFAGTVAASRERWSDVLGQIEIVGGTEKQKRIFYTAMYHAHFMPTDWVEANGKYFGFDQVSHDAGDHRYYTDFSMWDTFRTLHPLMNLLKPDVSADMMQSLTRMYLEGGAIPQWPCCDGYTGCMIGSPGHIVFADAYLKGVRDWDYETAYDGCFEQATDINAPRARSGLAEYISHGYVCEDLHSKGTSDTTEYSYADGALAWWAEALGYTDDAELLEERSHNYQNHWDEDIEFLRGRNCDGSWAEPYLAINPFGEQYVEGNAWHWSFYAPHDPDGLIELFGSEAAFVDKLNFSFEMGEQGPDNSWLPDLYYWHGNEPDLFNAYFFDSTSRPDLTQKWVRWVMGAKYDDVPGGLDGNDDCGTLSAWYIFSAMGFFPLAGSDRYFIGSPLFDEVTVHLPEGDLVITADNNSAENIYVQSFELNGEPWDQTWFTHGQIADGGTLHFVMGPEPSDWGTKK